jgi:hypothetical protein
MFASGSIIAQRGSKTGLFISWLALVILKYGISYLIILKADGIALGAR